MFKRIIYDDWTTVIPILSFWLTFSVFLIIVIRAIFLKKKTVNYMKNLPLEDGDNSTFNSLSK